MPKCNAGTMNLSDRCGDKVCDKARDKARDKACDEAWGMYRLIPFDVRHGNCGGSLVQFQPGSENKNTLPFAIGKVLVMSGIRPEDVRGNHAHFHTEEIVVVLQGGCSFDLDDGRGRHETVRLEAGLAEDQCPALLLYPHIWRVFHHFQPNTILLVIASIPYDEADYIRDRNAFEQLADSWQGHPRDPAD
ncbi:MAG: FdtA/QdtA family cupin domain-containing protein [Candidatus Marinimicrobia bacterium]|nr:FdtA/QdtA family cupin domain-containing protein [Candidatus Neomarinimicrobiota bacterium]